MADFTWQSLIDRAKVYADDDHEDEKGWIADDKWMVFAQVEYRNLRNRWMRMSLVGPAPTDQTFTGGTVTINNCAAIVGVAEVTDNSTPYRLLTPAQSFWGFSPYWGQLSSTAVTWSANGSASSITITLDPVDTDKTYVVRYIPTYTYATDASATVSLPEGWDERLVLGIAKRAHVKDSVRSSAIEDLIKQEEAEIAFAGFGRIKGDGPRVRRVKATASRDPFSWPSPNEWRYVS